jgi:hypothetical protein
MFFATDSTVSKTILSHFSSNCFGFEISHAISPTTPTVGRVPGSNAQACLHLLTFKTCLAQKLYVFILFLFGSEPPAWSQYGYTALAKFISYRTSVLLVLNRGNVCCRNIKLLIKVKVALLLSQVTDVLKIPSCLPLELFQTEERPHFQMCEYIFPLSEVVFALFIPFCNCTCFVRLPL